jgi:hypothetical protein
MVRDLATPSVITCPKCGAERRDGATSCPACGTAFEHATDDDVPLGTWSETGVAEPVVKPVSKRPKPRAESERPVPVPVPPRLRVHRGGKVEEPIEEHTPAPGSALALAPRTLKPDETGTRPRFGQSNVVPLAPRASGVRPAAEPPEPPAVLEADAAPEPREGTLRSVEREAVKPPILASELLAEDIEPTEPYRNPLRWVAGGGCLAAIVAIGAARPTDLMHWGVAAILGIVAVLGMIPIGYRVRAVAILVIALLGIGASSLTSGTLDWISLLLTLAATILSGGLFFRDAYRASWLGRALTGLGLAIGAAWLTASFWGHPFNEIGTEWQAWVPAALRLFSVLLGLLSLLAFMDSSTTGGSAIWATTALVWFACERLANAAIAMAAERDFHLIPLGDALAQIALVSAGALALTGVLVTAEGGTREQRATRRR